MAAPEQKLIATLLLSVLSSVVIIGIILAFLVVRWRNLRELSAGSAPPKPPSADVKSSHIHIHLRFKQPNCWLAIKNRDTLTVQSALSLHNPKPCSWEEGLSDEDGQKLFVSPPISGWTLVIGPALPDPDNDVDACFRFLLDLSRKLGHVQFFNVNSVVNHHAWVRAEDGKILRGYAWAGKTLWNQGIITQSERDLKMKCYAYAEGSEDRPFINGEPAMNNSDKVHLLAARWSVDPDDIDEHFIDQEWGIVGEPSRRY